MESKSSKNVLEGEVNDPNTNVHEPFENKYASQKIITYLWTCHYENQKIYEYKEWLLALYKNAGMSEDESNIFSSQIDLIIETMESNPKNK